MTQEIRSAEIRKRAGNVAQSVVEWAQTRTDIRAVALVGSHARDAARSDSDIDFVLLAFDPARFFESAGWIGTIDWQRLGAPVRFVDAHYGVCTSRHLLFEYGLEVEFGFVPLSWADVTPVDPGTQRVVSEGFRILYDPDARLAELLASILS